MDTCCCGGRARGSRLVSFWGRAGCSHGRCVCPSFVCFCQKFKVWFADTHLRFVVVDEPRKRPYDSGTEEEEGKRKVMPREKPPPPGSPLDVNGTPLGIHIYIYIYMHAML